MAKPRRFVASVKTGGLDANTGLGKVTVNGWFWLLDAKVRMVKTHVCMEFAWSHTSVKLVGSKAYLVYF